MQSFPLANLVIALRRRTGWMGRLSEWVFEATKGIFVALGDGQGYLRPPVSARTRGKQRMIPLVAGPRIATHRQSD